MSKISLILYLIGLAIIVNGLIELNEYYRKYQELQDYDKYRIIPKSAQIKYIDVDQDNNIIVEYEYNGQRYRNYNVLGNNFKSRLDAVIYASKLNGKNVDVYVYNNKAYLELNKPQDLGYPINALILFGFGSIFIYLGFKYTDYIREFISTTIKTTIGI